MLRDRVNQLKYKLQYKTTTNENWFEAFTEIPTSTNQNKNDSASVKTDNVGLSDVKSQLGIGMFQVFELHLIISFMYNVSYVYKVVGMK